MKKQHEKQQAFVPVLGNVVLVLLGLMIAMGLMEMLLRTLPNLVPVEVRVNPPARRVKAFIDEAYDLRQSDGDLYYLMRGNIVPLAPDQDQVVANIHMITDANGFRNSPPEKATYDIVALGDSFTRASGVAFCWPQKLTEYSGRSVLNLGDVGFGPQDELNMLQQYGLKKHPKLIIMAYFEGNDLYDAAAYEQANPFILTRFARYILDQSIDAWEAGRRDSIETAVTPSYRYPITVTINNKDLEMAFFSYYVSWLSVRRDEIASSQNYRITTENILRAQELSEAAGARFLLVYVPSKEHVYLPYVTSTDILTRVFTDVPTIELDEAGFLQFKSQRATPELVSQYMNEQSSQLAAFTAEYDINYLDLTPYFQNEAGTGAELYYPFDTHWNQSGHDLAAELINDYLKKIRLDTMSKTPRN